MAAFRKSWEEQRPEGTVIYRDPAAPVRHITADAWSAGYAAPSEHTRTSPPRSPRAWGSSRSWSRRTPS